MPCSLETRSLTYGRFGIPPELKRKMEEKALETMGENKASYLMKDAIGKVPASDQKVHPPPYPEFSQSRGSK